MVQRWLKQLKPGAQSARRVQLSFSPPSTELVPALPPVPSVPPLPLDEGRQTPL
jgi:hypothetical protein